MSFGYAIGDILLLTQIAWNVVQNSRKACGAHDELTSEVTSLHIVLRRLHLEVSKPNSILTRSDDSLDRRDELAQLSSNCKRVLRVLDGILEKYNALSEEKRSVTKLWKKVQFGNGEMLDLAELRQKLTASTSALTLFLNLLSIGSQGKVESYMESQGDELKEMRRSLNWITAEMQAKAPRAAEESILTTYAGDDKAIWKDFRRELIKDGFSSELLEKHKETIKDYVMELGSRGVLDDLEDDISDVNFPSVEMLASDGHRSPTEEDVVEVSEEWLPRGPNTDPENAEKGTENSPTSAEQPSLVKNFQEQENEQSVEDFDPKLLDGSHDTPNPGNQNKDDLDTGELIDPRKMIHVPEPISQKYQDSDTTCDESKSVREVELDSSIDVTDVGKDSVRTTIAAVSDNSGCSSEFVYNPIIQPKTAFGMTPKWFGPYFPRDSIMVTDSWNSLSVTLLDPLFSDVNPRAYSVPGELFHYHPYRLCHWILALARWYDSIQSLTLLVPHPKLFSPLAEELHLLVGRVCAYHARIRNHFSIKTNEDLGFPNVFKSFYLFIRGGIRYMLAEKDPAGVKHSANTLWILDDNLCWQQGFDIFVAGRALIDGRNTQSLYELETPSSICFLQGLFGEENDVHSSHAIHSIVNLSNPSKPLAAFLPELQLSLASFNILFEDMVLSHESVLYPARHQHLPGFHHVIAEIERRNPQVATATYELYRCSTGLEAWYRSFRDHWNKKMEAKINSFSRNEDSLSAILERRDEAQERLYIARQSRIWFTEREQANADRTRTGKRERKKKRW